MLDIDSCNGCGTCVSLCPFSAIDMIKDCSKGRYIPKINEKKCNHCGICLNICPEKLIDSKKLSKKIFLNVSKDTIGNYINCYHGYSTNNSIRYNSSSGGLVTAVLIYALEEGIIDGALVTRMKEDHPLEPESFIARTKNEIIEASGSKYCPVSANLALSEILKKEGKYAVVGLPCHIRGVRKAEIQNSKLKERIILHISIFCSGVKNFRASEFLLRRMNISVDDIKKIEYRGNGWPGNMTIHLRNGQTKVIPYPEYWNGFGNLFYPLCCLECSDWFSNSSDLSFGDAWLPEIKKIDILGTSAIISRTMQGENILKMMLLKGRITLNPIDENIMYKSQPGFAHKMKRLSARINLSEYFGVKLQRNDQDSLPEPTFKDYVDVISLYLKSVLASRNWLWWLLDIYMSLLYHYNKLRSN